MRNASDVPGSASIQHACEMNLPISSGVATIRPHFRIFLAIRTPPDVRPFPAIQQTAIIVRRGAKSKAGGRWALILVLTRYRFGGPSRRPPPRLCLWASCCCPACWSAISRGRPRRPMPRPSARMSRPALRMGATARRLQRRMICVRPAPVRNRLSRSLRRRRRSTSSCCVRARKRSKAGRRS